MSDGHCPSCGVPTEHRYITGHICEECLETYSMGHSYISEWNALSGASHMLRRIIEVQYLLPFTTQMMDSQALFSEAPFPTSQVVVQDIIDRSMHLVSDTSLLSMYLPIEQLDLLMRVNRGAMEMAQGLLAIDHSMHRGILEEPELIWSPDQIREELDWVKNNATKP